MGRYRIGTDMTILWSINDGNGAALPLKDKEVHLYYSCERGRFEAEIEIQGHNVIAWNFLGREQRALGDYTLTVEIIQTAGKRRKVTKDYCKAFTLVGKTREECCHEGLTDIGVDNTLTLSSKLDIYRIQPIVPVVGNNSNWWVDGEDTGNPSYGTTAFQYAQSKGFKGTEEEFAILQAETPEFSKKLTEVFDYLKKGEAYVYNETLTFRNYINAEVDNQTLTL